MQPTPYTRATSFADDERDNVGGRSTVRTARVDAELDAVGATANQTAANLGLIQRDDGQLADAIVYARTLAADTLKLMAASGGTPRGAWLTATVYAQKDLITSSGNTYVCVVAHTSGTFVTDLAAGKWLLIQLGATPNAAAVAFTPTATLAATDVQAAIVEADTENRALSAAASAAAAAASALATGVAANLDAYTTVTPAEAGATPERVTVWIQRERLFAGQFPSLQSAINAASLRGMPLNLGGQTFVTTGGLVFPAAGVEIEHGNIAAPALSSGGYVGSTTGTLGTGLVVSGPVTRGASVLTVPDTSSLIEGEWYKLASADLWADNGAGSAVSLGEWVRVKTKVSSTQVQLYKSVEDTYSTTIRLYPVTWTAKIILTDVHLTGGGAGLNQNGLLLGFVKDVRVYDSDTRSFASRGMYYPSCLRIDIDGGTPGDGDDTTGLSYGHLIGGATVSAVARNVKGDTLRHVITAGGSDGVVRGYRCQNITGSNMTDATVDAHPSVDDAVFYGIRHNADLYWLGSPNPPLGSDGDGIVSQARSTTVDAYEIRRPGRHGILIQPACKVYKARARVGKGTIMDHGSCSATSGWGVNLAIDYPNTLGLAQAHVNGADIESGETYANGIQIAASVAGMAYGTINARVTTPGRAVLARGDGATVANLQINGGYYERSTSTAETVMLWGTASGQVTQSKLIGAYVKGGANAVRGLNATSSHVAANTIKNYATAAVSGITHNGTTDFVVNNET